MTDETDPLELNLQRLRAACQRRDLDQVGQNSAKTQTALTSDQSIIESFLRRLGWRG